MDPRTPSQPGSPMSVSNLVPVWDEPAADGGGSFEPAAAAIVVEQIVHPEVPADRPRLVTPPEQFDPAEPVERRSAFTYDLLDERGTTWAEAHEVRTSAPAGVAAAVQPGAPAAAVDASDLPQVDYDALARRDIARELLRARLVRLAEQREHRSAYELVFLMLAASVAVLLAAPPLVQVLLAARGIQA